MSLDLVDILNLEELLDPILSYCSKEDSLNLSLCSRQFNEALRPVLWRSVTIPCNQSSITNISRDDVIKKFEYTEKIHFHAPGLNSVWDMPRLAIPQHGNGGRLRSLTLDGILFMRSFEKLMTHCAPKVIRITDDFPTTANIPLEYMGGVFDPEKLRPVQELIFEVKSVKFGISRMFEMMCERLPHLRKLVVGYYPGRAYTPLTQLPMLEELTLHMGLGSTTFDGYWSQCALTDEGLFLISNLTYLKKLKLFGTGKLTDEGYASLTQLRALTHLYILNLEKPRVGNSNNAIPFIGLITSLTVLDLQFYDVNDENVGSLSALENLRRLNLSHTRITDAGARELVRIVTLEVLFISDTRLTDVFALDLSKAWCQMSALQVLNINHTQVSDKGLAHLRSVGSLKTIYCDNCHVTSSEILNFQAKVLSVSRLRTMASFDAKYIPSGIYCVTTYDSLQNELIN